MASRRGDNLNEHVDDFELLATFKVTSGINHDYSMTRSAPFIVAGPSPTAAAPASG